MRFVTDAADDGDRAGLPASQEVYALPPGVRLGGRRDCFRRAADRGRGR